MAQERVFVIIDGSNFYHRLRELFERRKHLSVFDYEGFTSKLSGKREIYKKKYYIGVVRAKQNDEKGQSMRKYQQRIFAQLRQGGWQVERGYILKTKDGYFEKGVDVHIAVDLLIGAYENLYDSVIIMSSDTDLIPALIKVRAMKKKVEYVGFSHKPSYGLISNSDKRKLLAEEDLIDYFKRESK